MSSGGKGNSGGEGSEKSKVHDILVCKHLYETYYYIKLVYIFKNLWNQSQGPGDAAW